MGEAVLNNEDTGSFYFGSYTDAPAHTIGHKKITISTNIDHTETGGNDDVSKLSALSGGYYGVLSADSYCDATSRSEACFGIDLEINNESVPRVNRSYSGEAVLNNEETGSSDFGSYTDAPAHTIGYKKLQ